MRGEKNIVFSHPFLPDKIIFGEDLVPVHDGDTKPGFVDKFGTVRPRFFPGQLAVPGINNPPEGSTQASFPDMVHHRLRKAGKRYRQPAGARAGLRW